MKVVSKNLDNGHVWLDCKATAKEVNDAFEKAHVRFANQMGWQPEPGKTVAKVAEERMGIKDLDSIVKDTVLEFFGPFAIDKRGIMPAYPGTVNPMGPLERGREFVFSMVILPKPSFELSSYEPLVLKAQRVRVEEGKVQQLIDEVTDHFSTLVTSDDTTPVAAGDSVLLKMSATKGGQPFAGMTFERRPYVTNMGYMPDGFDENLYGMEIGQEKSFSFQAPTFDNQGQTVFEEICCTVTVLEKQVAQQPELTDEWVQRFLPGYGTAAEFIKAAEAQVEAEREMQQRAILEEVATEEVANRFEGRIPDEMYEYMMRDMMKNIEARVVAEGKTMDDYIKEAGGEQAVTMMLMLEIRQNLAQNFALDAVYKHFKLSYKDSDIDAVCALMNPQNPKMVRQELEGVGQSYLLRESAERLVAVHYLIDNADITYEG